MPAERLPAGWLVAIIMLAAGILLATSLPDSYYTGADEGTYFRQGSALVEHGIAAGYRHLANDYIQTPAQQEFPNPLRVGTIAASATALQIHHGYRALSWLSIVAFLALLLITWRFVVRFWDQPLALATLVLMAASPLGLALARRALMDSLAMATGVATVFAFFSLLERPGRWRLPVFIVVTTLALVVKETAVLLLPFYAAVLFVFWWRKTLPLPPWQALLALCLPPLLTIGAWLMVYGPDASLAIVDIVLHVANTPTPYTVAYGRGPWFVYPVDFMLLSPWVFMLAVAGVGQALLRGTDRWSFLMLLLAVWLLIAYLPLTKNPRYIQLIDLPLRLFAAGMVLDLVRHWWPLHINASAARIRDYLRQPGCWVSLMLIAVLAGRDVTAFWHDFIRGGIYDPVTWNLLRAREMIPLW